MPTKGRARKSSLDRAREKIEELEGKLQFAEHRFAVYDKDALTRRRAINDLQDDREKLQSELRIEKSKVELHQLSISVAGRENAALRTSNAKLRDIINEMAKRL